MCKQLNRQFLKKVKIANKFMKKFNSFSHQGSAIAIETPLHPNQNGYHRENKREVMRMSSGILLVGSNWKPPP